MCLPAYPHSSSLSIVVFKHQKQVHQFMDPSSHHHVDHTEVTVFEASTALSLQHGLVCIADRRGQTVLQMWPPLLRSLYDLFTTQWLVWRALDLSRSPTASGEQAPRHRQSHLGVSEGLAGEAGISGSCWALLRRVHLHDVDMLLCQFRSVAAGRRGHSPQFND